MSTTTAPAVQPPVRRVRVSGDAIKSLTTRMRMWSGWADSRVIIGEPDGSPFGHTDMVRREFVFNADNLLLNPNRVLRTVNPFRLRQEAVLTGVMLHEAGHARHSKWMGPDKPPVHTDGTPATKQTVALALLMEEPRVEGLMAADAPNCGALGLEWTMRAASAALLPMSEVSSDPSQAVMDVIESWAKRAGRALAFNEHTPYQMGTWVGDFNSLLHSVLVDFLSSDEHASTNPTADAVDVLSHLTSMARADAVVDETPFMLDAARYVLSLLFPETDGDSDGAPMPGGCACSGGAGEPGEDESDPESGEQGEGGAEAQSEGDEPGEEQAEGSGSGSEEGEGEEETQSAAAAAMQEKIDAMEATAKSEAETDALEGKAAPPQVPGLSSAGVGAGGSGGGSWRSPTAAERVIQKGAEKFLRDLIDPTESSTRRLTDDPSTQVDGAALSAWKAGGQQRDPRFFVRVRREVTPAPPVKIGILVDVSSSMDEMQAPSAVLSWALSNAALDLRNFAGRGVQVESTLIHWGDDAATIVPVGGTLPGLREFGCHQGTSGLHHGLDELAVQMPDFFTVSEKPENRLLVIFTDWQLFGPWRAEVIPRVEQLMEAGVNILSVMPAKKGSGLLGAVLSQCPIKRGRSIIARVDEKNPGAVWKEAAAALVR